MLGKIKSKVFNWISNILLALLIFGLALIPNVVSQGIHFNNLRASINKELIIRAVAAFAVFGLLLFFKEKLIRKKKSSGDPVPDGAEEGAEVPDGDEEEGPGEPEEPGEPDEDPMSFLGDWDFNFFEVSDGELNASINSLLVQMGMEYQYEIRKYRGIFKTLYYKNSIKFLVNLKKELKKIQSIDSEDKTKKTQSDDKASGDKT